MKIKLNRLDKLRKVRSLNDVIAIINEITRSFKQSKKIVDNLKESLSADDDVIVFDYQTEGRKPVSKKSQKPATLSTKLTKWVSPPKREVEKHLKVIRDLYDNAVDLDSAEALLVHSFASSKKQPAALRAIKALKAEINSTLNKAFSALNGLADKHLPTEMEMLGDAILGYLIEHLPKKTYKNIAKSVYVYPGEKSSLHFALYIKITNLQNAEGYVFDEYFFILTGVVDSKGYISYYLNSVPEFKVPGKYNLGKQVETEKDAIQRLRMLLDHNDVLSQFERKPMPVDADRAKTSGLAKIPNVVDVDVKNDQLIVYLKPGKDGPTQINNVVVKVIPLLKAMLGKSAKQAKILVGKTSKTRKGTALPFALVPATPSGEKTKYTINIDKLNELQYLLDLSDEEVNAIKYALKHV